MNSMTGFGRGIAADEALQITVEIKTVNSRFLICILICRPR